MRHIILGTALVAAFTPALASDPASGTLTAANDEAHPLVYTANGSDSFTLTTDLPAGYAAQHPQTYIRVQFSGDVAAESESLHADTSTPDPTDSTAHWADGRPLAEGVNQALLIASSGPRNVIIDNSGGNGTVNVSIALVHIPDDPGNRDLPTAAHGIGPRFAVHKPKRFPGIGLAAAEPTIGLNPNTGSVFYMNTLEALRVKFDDNTTPAQDNWQQRAALESALVTLDPILASDLGTGRVFSLNLSGPISTADFSDDDGESWLPGGNGFPTSGVDHQSLGAGPYPTSGLGSLIPHPLYPDAVYYCSQGVVIAYCSRSDDGGINFNPAVPIYNAVTLGGLAGGATSGINNCTGLHGHIKVGGDGTVYLPNKGCDLDLPIYGRGLAGLLISHDAGETWDISEIPDITSGIDTKSDPSVAIGNDNTIYFGLSPLDEHLRVAVSRDGGQTWINTTDVGAIAGVHASQFPAMVAGDAGRAAVAFLGTQFPAGEVDPGTNFLNASQPAEANDYPGVWHLYVATTLDYGEHWFVEMVAPEDLAQGPGGIGGSGANRNLLDFIDAAIDLQGRILVGYADGCLGDCAAGTQGHFHRVAAIARQSGGPRMLSAFDPVEPAKPAAPRLTGYRTPGYVVLTIDADNGGSPITGYDITRDGATIASNYGATTFVDQTANAPGATYHYHATAINALGESDPSNEFAPLADENAPVTAAVCSLPGQLWGDEVGEPGARPPWADLVSLGIAEPADQPGKLVLTVTPAASIPLQGDATYVTVFDHPNGRRYTIQVDTTGTTTYYTDGRYYSDTTAQAANVLGHISDVPALDSSAVTSNGNVVIVIDKATWGLATGDLLKNVTVRALPAANEGLVFVHDDLGYDISQPIVGNDFCAKGAVPPPPVVAIPNPTPTASGGDTTRFGGALNWLTLLGLLVGRALARRRREGRPTI
jgi:hypothetical protein